MGLPLLPLLVGAASEGGVDDAAADGATPAPSSRQAAASLRDGEAMRFHHGVGRDGRAFADVARDIFANGDENCERPAR
jgi:hypothetical protein